MFGEMISLISIIVFIIWIRVDYKNMKVDKQLIEKIVELNSNIKVYIENQQSTDEELNISEIKFSDEVIKIIEDAAMKENETLKELCNNPKAHII